MGWVRSLRSAVRAQLAPTTQRKRSIRGRLRWSYLLTSTLPLLLVGIILIVMSFRAQRENVYTNQVTLARSVARDASTYLSGMEAQILRLGLNLGPDVPRERLISAVGELFRANYPNIRELAIINTDGREVLHQYGNSALRPEELPDRGADKAVRAALTGLGERGDIRKSDDGTPVYTLLLPLRDSASNVKGALSAEISAAPLTLVLRSGVSNAGVVYLVDSRQHVMLTNSEQTLTAPVGLADLFAAPVDVTQYVGASGQPVVGARGLISPVGWSIVVEQPSGIAFASLWRSVIVLTLLVAVMGLLALAWALRQSRQITLPLNALGKGAATLGAGHLDHRIPLRGDDELTDLAQTFNRMAERLQFSLSQIEHQNERLRHGLALARDIQVGLLPTVAPWNVDTLAVYARSLPAYEVGGDFYTYMAMPEGRAAIAIGDISGKGVGAALLMALTSSLIESHSRQTDHPAQVLDSLNTTLTPRMKANRMNAAVLYAVLDPTNLALTVANAGMIAPLLIGKSGARFMDIGGLPIGVLPTATYSEHEVTLDPGDALLFITDGVVEAHNAQGELFGFERLEALVAAMSDNTDVRTLVISILDSVQAFMGDTEQHDDITLVAVQPAHAHQFEGPMQEMELEIRAP